MKTVSFSVAEELETKLIEKESEKDEFEQQVKSYMHGSVCNNTNN